MVAAAGNNGVYARTLDMPADDPFVIAAGASDTMKTANPFDDRVADFSSRSRFRTPDFVAPGSNVVSLRVPGSTLDTEFAAARVEGKFFRGSGTSQAAAITSGLVARLLSAKPWLNPDQVKATLIQSAVDLPDPRSADGAGRVDLRRALGLPTPDADSVAQRFEPAVLDLNKLRRELMHGDDDLGPGAQWNGRRWSGRRWSGRRWSGAKWTDSAD